MQKSQNNSSVSSNIYDVDSNQTPSVTKDLYPIPEIIRNINDNVNVPLKHIEDKSFFLTRLGIISSIYWSFMSGTLLFMMINSERFRELYWLYKLNIFFWFYFVILIAIKTTYSFAGHVMPRLPYLFFFFDLLFSYLVIIGAYY